MVKKKKYNKLKGRMKELEISQKVLADELDITQQSINAKLNGKTSFTIEEVEKISVVLKLENPLVYFFSKTYYHENEYKFNNIKNQGGYKYD